MGHGENSPEWVQAGPPQAVVDGLTDHFAGLFGRAPETVGFAPGRVNLIGEHLDYNEGRCLPMALPHGCFAAVAAREDRRVRLASRQLGDTWVGTLDALGPGEVDGWVGYVAGVLWAMQQQGFDVPGVDVLVDSRVPVGAGLSSSAALECSVAVAVCETLGIALTDEARRLLVRACISAEGDVVGAPTGGMDQTIALFGRPGHALLLDCRDWSTEQVPWEPADHSLQLLVIDTRASHELSDGGYAARRADCEEAARLLGAGSLREVDDQQEALARLTDDRIRRRARHVFTEMNRVGRAVAQLRGGDLSAFGETLNASHASLRDDFEVSCPELDAACVSSLGTGALGARMTGGGFGGSAIALVPRADIEDVARNVAREFDRRGFPEPGFLVAEPHGGATASRTGRRAYVAETPPI